MNSARLLHGLEQGRGIVREQSGTLLLLSAPGGIEFGGPDFYLEILNRLREEFPGRDIELLLDCGDNGALAIEAIRLGAKDIHFNGHLNATHSILNIAKTANVRLWQSLPEAD